MQSHPEDRIYKTKDFVNELTKVQDRYFKKLVKKLKIPTEELELLLFDFVFNAQEPKTFGEYLDEMGKGHLWEGL